MYLFKILYLKILKEKLSLYKLKGTEDTINSTINGHTIN